MKMTMHRITKVKAISSNGTEWISFTDDMGNEAVLFVPIKLAGAFEEAFYDYENWLTSQEGPTYDEALGAKCDREASLDRQLRDAGRI